MIKITNGINVLMVTNGSYREQYKPFGWVPVGERDVVELPDAAEKRSEQQAAEAKRKAEEEAKAKIAADVAGVKESESEELESEELESEEQFVPEKPLAEMSNAELREKAKQLNVDISGLETRKQVRAAISNAMRG